MESSSHSHDLGNETERDLFVNDGAGDRVSKARQKGDVVLRSAGPWSGSVHALLRHFKETGFSGCPDVVGTGFADDGREVLSYLPGTSPHPGPWTNDALAVIGTMLKELHDAGRSFTPPSNATWQPIFSRELSGEHPTYGHCDLGPWNVVAVDGKPSGFVDWEFAGPIDAYWELAEVAWLNCQLHDDDVAEMCGLPGPTERAEQLRILLDGYRLDSDGRSDFVDRMISLAVHAARSEAVEFNIQPTTTSAVSDSGYPFLWGVTWRVRSASWMISNKSVLERGIH